MTQDAEIKTVVGGTDTVDGWIPYWKHKGFDCPVKLVTEQTENDSHKIKCDESKMPHPKYSKISGRLYFVLPGGQEVMS